MANPEHLKRIRAGVENWNRWRRDHPMTSADLSNADLSGMSLDNAHLCGANLSNANLSKACLFGADLRGARIRGANFSGVNIRGANLSGADLRGADLGGTNLRSLNLSRADLGRANLSKTRLGEACLARANLRGANLSGANLGGGDLSRADLSRADLSEADLRHAILTGSNLTKAELTGAKLFGTSRGDWTVADIKCRYVYWDSKGESRSPRERELEPGEFDELYRTLPTIEYIFENGMSPIDLLIVDRLVESIRGEHPEYGIMIESIHARGLAPSIRLAVRREEHAEPALAEVTKMYCEYMESLEADKYALSGYLAQAIEDNRVTSPVLAEAVTNAQVGSRSHGRSS